MTILTKKFFIFHVLILSLISFAFSVSQTKDNKNLYDNPTQFRKYVTDETGTLTASQINTLNAKLQNEDKATTNQIIVYMIQSLNGESLEEVSIKLAEKNKIGKKDRNNGMLLLIVKDDRKVRLEVGYGLEGVMTDALSSKIIRKDITPSFKEGNYYEGIDKGVDAIIASIKGEYTADKESSDSSGMNQTCCFGLPIFVILIFGLIFFFIFISIIKSIASGHSVYTGKRGWNNGGWGGGGWGGGGGSWGGGSGGGFSGGGGSFGGGGASGSW